MKYLKITLAMAVLVFFASSCSDDEDSTSGTAAERIVGQWNITSSNILGIDVPGGDSYLRFDACATGATECSGVDYDSFDETSGEFTYTINAEGTKLTNEDNDSNGGAYDGVWDIKTLTNSSMNLEIQTFLGKMTLDLDK